MRAAPDYHAAAGRPAGTVMACEGASTQILSGWGGAPGSAAWVERVRTQEAVERLARSAAGSGRVLARGLGRAYGDAAQCAGGTVVDCTGLDQVLEADFSAGVVRVEAGISIGSLLRVVLPQGWFLPVMPGTRHVTVGGAIAADVHGKNHHRDGSFSSWVKHLSLVTADDRVETGPDLEPGVFWATCGGMGLTGIIVEATLQLVPAETPLMLADTERAADLDECMAALESGDERCRYSVAWVDAAAHGRRLGRAVLSRGDHARRRDLPADGSWPQARYDPRPVLSVPLTPPVNLVAPAAIAVGNELWFRKAPARRGGELQPVPAFFHPLDAIGKWNRLYGPRGFTQYQFAVPFESGNAVRGALELLAKAGVVSSLAVLKRFGAASPGPLSFPCPGWTLALDIPLARPRVAAVLDRLDELVVSAGGRVYLAKDGRLSPHLLGQMYPRLDEWRAVRERLDPSGVFSSDLARRLGLVS